MKKSLLVLLLIAINVFSAGKKFTVTDAVIDMSPGWNLGNALDSIPNEDSWNNKPTRRYTIEDIKKAGFRSIRIPVTWTHHTGPAPFFKVDPAWMDRVEEVVDWALEEDLWVILNVHHDSWEWMNVMRVDPVTGKYVNDYENYIVRLEKLWSQIAKRFSKKSLKLIFEILNEPNDGQWEPKPEKPENPKNPAVRHDLSCDEMNRINNRILNLIRKTGGLNKKRFVMVAGPGNDPEKTLKCYTPINDPNIIMTVHYYAPWDFVSGWWGHYTWGTTNEKKYAEEIFNKLNEAYVKKGLPVVVGEWGAFTRTELFSKWYYYNYLGQLMRRYNMAAIWWDNGADHFDREKRRWRDPVVKDIVVNAGLGIPNSFVMLSDIFINSKEPLKDITLPLELNGNQLVDIYLLKEKNKEKIKLIKDNDYSLNNTNVIISANFLNKIIDLKNIGKQPYHLLFDFSRGTDQPVNLIVFDKPVLNQTKITIESFRMYVSSDIKVPLKYNGMKLAAVKLVDKVKKEPIKENWTPYVNVGDDFDYDYENDLFILRYNLLSRIKKNAILTLEFWPKGVNLEIEIEYTEKKSDAANNSKIQIIVPFDSEKQIDFVSTKDPVKIGISEVEKSKALYVKIDGLKGWAQDYLNFDNVDKLTTAWNQAKEICFKIYLPQDFIIGNYCTLIPILQSKLNYWMPLAGINLNSLPRNQWIDIRIPIDNPDFITAIPQLFKIIFVFNCGDPIEGSIFIKDFGFSK